MTLRVNQVQSVNQSMSTPHQEIGPNPVCVRVACIKRLPFPCKNSWAGWNLLGWLGCSKTFCSWSYCNGDCCRMHTKISKYRKSSQVIQFVLSRFWTTLSWQIEQKLVGYIIEIAEWQPKPRLKFVHLDSPLCGFSSGNCMRQVCCQFIPLIFS